MLEDCLVEQAAAARSLLQQLQKLYTAFCLCACKNIVLAIGYSCQVPAAALEDKAAPVSSHVLHLQGPPCRQQLCQQRVQALSSSWRYKKGPTGTPEVKV